MLKYIFLGCLFLLINCNIAFAQSQEYTDYKPVYRKWRNNYILDKIDYEKSTTIFYFRFVSDSGHRATFFEPGHESAWYLKGKNGKDYKLKAVKNIRMNGELLVSNLTSEKEYQAEGIGYTTFSCEVHFERLPNTEKVVDLIEGEGYVDDRYHFNCFEVALKTWDNKELGKIEDSQKNIEKFENKFGIANKEPNKETKVEPKKEQVDKVDTPKVEYKLLPDPNNPYPNRRVRNKTDIRCDEKLVLDKIKFKDNTTDYKEMVQCQTAVYLVYEYMHDNPNTTATVIGHTDVFGPKDRNLELSKQRAIKIQRWLSSMGISPNRLNIEYHGSEQPIVKEGSALNRRVEIYIKCN
jgi:outer membrane protein OmpA-like peptidoglycan-associated protein